MSTFLKFIIIGILSIGFIGMEEHHKRNLQALQKQGDREFAFQVFSLWREGSYESLSFEEKKSFWTENQGTEIWIGGDGSLNIYAEPAKISRLTEHLPFMILLKEGSQSKPKGIYSFASK